MKICFFFSALFFFFFKDGIGREEELRQVPEGSHIRFKLKIKLTRFKASKAHLICQMVAGGASFAFIPGSHQGGTGLFRKSVTGMKGKNEKKKHYTSMCLQFHSTKKLVRLSTEFVSFITTLLKKKIVNFTQIKGAVPFKIHFNFHTRHRPILQSTFPLSLHNKFF